MLDSLWQAGSTLLRSTIVSRNEANNEEEVTGEDMCGRETKRFLSCFWMKIDEREWGYEEAAMKIVVWTSCFVFKKSMSKSTTGWLSLVYLSCGRSFEEDTDWSRDVVWFGLQHCARHRNGALRRTWVLRVRLWLLIQPCVGVDDGTVYFNHLRTGERTI